MFNTDFGLIMNVTGTSNKELAKHLEIDHQQVADWIFGHRLIPNIHKQKISDFLQVDITEEINEKEKIMILESSLTKYLGKKIKIEFTEERKIIMNKNQIGDMEHAIKNGRFYTDIDDKDWNDLVEKGYATKQTGWDTKSAYYLPTSEGKAALRELLK